MQTKKSVSRISTAARQGLTIALLIMFFIAGAILFFTELWIPIRDFSFERRNEICFLMGLAFAISLSFHVIQIIWTKGMQVIAADRFQLYGPVGDIIGRGIFAYSAFYTSYTILVFSLMGRMPDELSAESLVLICIAMALILGWSSYQLSLILQAVIFQKGSLAVMQ
ncbi:MAG: hypothetical protein KAR39_02800 [Thermoplasmata archaeon]|nr:hypothetical protein [Thermoplasmata archaeon]